MWHAFYRYVCRQGFRCRLRPLPPASSDFIPFAAFRVFILQSHDPLIARQCATASVYAHFLCRPPPLPEKYVLPRPLDAPFTLKTLESNLYERFFAGPLSEQVKLSANQV